MEWFQNNTQINTWVAVFGRISHTLCSWSLLFRFFPFAFPSLFQCRNIRSWYLCHCLCVCLCFLMRGWMCGPLFVYEK